MHRPLELFCTTQSLAKTRVSREEIDAASDEVRRGCRTWRAAPPVELYDLQSDPCEFTNLAGRPEWAEVEATLHHTIEEWQTDR